MEELRDEFVTPKIEEYSYIRKVVKIQRIARVRLAQVSFSLFFFFLNLSFSTCFSPTKLNLMSKKQNKTKTEKNGSI